MRFTVYRSAFTLIELLVVISIISILVALLLPALAAARDQAVRIQCASQLRQFAVGLFMYSDDSEGAFPTVHWGYANQFRGGDYGSMVMRGYFGMPGRASSSVSTNIGGLSVLLCPNDDPRLSPAYVNYSYGNSMGTSYRIVAGHGDRTPVNGSGNWWGWASQTRDPAKSDATPVPNINMVGRTPIPLSPSGQPILGDIWSPTGIATLNGSGHYGAPDPVQINHEAGSNAAFADGHGVWTNADNLKRKIAFYSSNRLWW